MAKDTGCRGYTLIEVVLASLLLMIMLTGLYGLFDSALAISKRMDSQVIMQQDLRLAMDRIMREVRQSKGEVTVGDGTYIEFLDWRLRRVKYYLKESNHGLYRNDGSTNKPLVGGISSVRFTYDQTVQQVEISLEGLNDRYDLQSRVTLRSPDLP
ncbi:MAG: prepilin-type N-terminal cleavage/methylation domain-containing protein [Bacillota bacterium]